jgi:hypothetical protein
MDTNKLVQVKTVERITQLVAYNNNGIPMLGVVVNGKSAGDFIASDVLFIITGQPQTAKTIPLQCHLFCPALDADAIKLQRDALNKVSKKRKVR